MPIMNFSLHVEKMRYGISQGSAKSASSDSTSVTTKPRLVYPKLDSAARGGRAWAVSQQESC